MTGWISCPATRPGTGEQCTRHALHIGTHWAAGGEWSAPWMCPACREHGACTDAVRCQCPCQTDGPRVAAVELCGDLELRYQVRCTRRPHDDTAPHTAPVLGGGLIAWGPAVGRWEGRRTAGHAHATPADRAPGVAPRLAANPAVRTAAALSTPDGGTGHPDTAEALWRGLVGTRWTNADVTAAVRNLLDDSSPRDCARLLEALDEWRPGRGPGRSGRRAAGGTQ